MTHKDITAKPHCHIRAGDQVRLLRLGILGSVTSLNGLHYVFISVQYLNISFATARIAALLVTSSTAVSTPEALLKIL